VTGHRHQQEAYSRDPTIGNAAWVVSGGGGGITSEGLPREDGNDDMYGFFDVTISKSEIKLESISHGGIVRKTMVVTPRVEPTTATSTSTITDTTTTTTTTTTTHAPRLRPRPDAAAGTMSLATRASGDGPARGVALLFLALVVLHGSLSSCCCL